MNAAGKYNKMYLQLHKYFVFTTGQIYLELHISCVELHYTFTKPY